MCAYISQKSGEFTIANLNEGIIDGFKDKKMRKLKDRRYSLLKT